jgi:hypothetical protein
MIEKNIQGIGALALRAPPYFLPRTKINEHEYSVYSQFGEDGILTYIFSRIPPKTKMLIEIGCGSGRQCLSANLVINFGWTGMLVDGSNENVRDARNFFKYLLPWRHFEKLRIEHAFITKENINEIIARRTETSQPDLLAIDIDGNDFWVWEAIERIDPPVVVIEYNSNYGADEFIVTPYAADFDTYKENPLGLYHGPSLVALRDLADKKGYILIGCESNGANAFFVKKEYATHFGEVTPKEAFYEDQHKAKRGSVQKQFAMIKDKPFIRTYGFKN